MFTSLWVVLYVSFLCIFTSYHKPITQGIAYFGARLRGVYKKISEVVSQKQIRRNDEAASLGVIISTLSVICLSYIHQKLGKNKSMKISRSYQKNIKLFLPELPGIKIGHSVVMFQRTDTQTHTDLIHS